MCDFNLGQECLYELQSVFNESSGFLHIQLTYADPPPVLTALWIADLNSGSLLPGDAAASYWRSTVFSNSYLPRVPWVAA